MGSLFQARLKALRELLGLGHQSTQAFCQVERYPHSKSSMDGMGVHPKGKFCGAVAIIWNCRIRGSITRW